MFSSMKQSFKKYKIPKFKTDRLGHLPILAISLEIIIVGTST